jgi:Lrp/AsnC family leucine-responsive transcriptional regulator
MEHPTDLALLRALEADARISFGDLGEKVGLSKSACWARVRALERAGAIRGYGADIESAAVGLAVRAWVQITVSARRHAEFEAAIVLLPNVLECYTAAGQADYVLQVLAPDIAALDGLLRGELAKLPGVERVTTTVCLKTIKRRGGIMPCVRRGAR